MPQRDYGSRHASPRPHSSASLRREYLPRMHKCMATREKHPGFLPPEEIWKKSCPNDCTSPKLVFQPDLRRRGYSVLRLVNWVAIVATCTAADRDDCHNHETTLAGIRYAALTASVQTI